jgi:hypothetical protein
MLLNIIFCEASEISNKSIQGKNYSNRTNGIYDKTMALLHESLSWLKYLKIDMVLIE